MNGTTLVVLSLAALGLLAVLATATIRNSRRRKKLERADEAVARFWSILEAIRPDGSSPFEVRWGVTGHGAIRSVNGNLSPLIVVCKALGRDSLKNTDYKRAGVALGLPKRYTEEIREAEDAAFINAEDPIARREPRLRKQLLAATVWKPDDKALDIYCDYLQAINMQGACTFKVSWSLTTNGEIRSTTGSRSPLIVVAEFRGKGIFSHEERQAAGQAMDMSRELTLQLIAAEDDAEGCDDDLREMLLSSTSPIPSMVKTA